MGRVRRQFEAVAEHNKWTHREKATYLITAFNESATHILHGVPTSATHDGLTDVLQNRYYDHHLEVAFHSQLKRIQSVGESPQEFVTAIDH
jgi:GGDEF domain-containing protein